MAIAFSNKSSGAFPGKTYRSESSFYAQEAIKNKILDKAKGSRENRAEDIEKFLNLSGDENKDVSSIFTSNAIYTHAKSIIQNEQKDAALGLEFEKSFTDLINSIYAKQDVARVTGKDQGTIPIMIGNNKDARVAKQVFEELKKSLDSDLSKLIKNFQTSLINDVQKQQKGKYLKLTSIKSDVMVDELSIDDIEITESNEFEILKRNFLQAVSGKRFSLKEYGRDTIALGETDLIRTFSGVFSSFYSDLNWYDVEKIFYANMNKSKANYQSHRLHRGLIRFAYELAGFGIQGGTATGFSQTKDLLVDYLIIHTYNNSQRPYKVYDVGELIKKILGDNKRLLSFSNRRTIEFSPSSVMKR